jgi:hypothetical protein
MNNTTVHVLELLETAYRCDVTDGAWIQDIVHPNKRSPPCSKSVARKSAGGTSFSPRRFEAFTAPIAYRDEDRKSTRAPKNVPDLRNRRVSCASL